MLALTWWSKSCSRDAEALDVGARGEPPPLSPPPVPWCAFFWSWSFFVLKCVCVCVCECVPPHGARERAAALPRVGVTGGRAEGEAKWPRLPAFAREKNPGTCHAGRTGPRVGDS